MSDITQNMSESLGRIGEDSVVLQLSLLSLGKGWDVFRNINSPGYDVLLQHKARRKTIRIEVKTRQRIYTTSKHTPVHFTLTENEYKSSDFVICYWWERNHYFVVPTSSPKISKVRSGTKILYKFIVRERKDGSFHETQEAYRNKWDLISKDFSI
jgi:hypothetical protein